MLLKNVKYIYNKEDCTKEENELLSWWGYMGEYHRINIDPQNKLSSNVVFNVWQSPLSCWVWYFSPLQLLMIFCTQTLCEVLQATRIWLPKCRMLWLRQPSLKLWILDPASLTRGGGRETASGHSGYISQHINHFIRRLDQELDIGKLKLTIDFTS